MKVESADINLLEEKTLRRILGSFSRATGLRAVFCDLAGSPVVTPGRDSPDAPFCRLVRGDIQGRKRCAKSYATAGRESAKWGEPYIFRCHAGLVGWAAPVLQEQEHVFTIICSQVLMWEPEEFFWEEIRAANQDLNVGFSDLFQAAQKLEVISPERVQAAADLLFVTANYLTRKGSIILEQRREIQEQQARFQELLGKPREEYLPIYSFQKERELVEKVKMGKGNQAEEILDEIMADELVRYVSKPELVKGRFQELLVLISRAVAQGEWDLPLLLEINLCHSKSLLAVQSYHDLCFLTKKALREYLSFRCSPPEDGSLDLLLEKVKKYIEVHYYEDMTIEGIARVVHLSPHYLCRLFKQQFGCTLMEYVTFTRIEQAKELLFVSKEPVQQVGAQVGFNNPAYFSKVFKRMTGLTPLQFRRRLKEVHKGGDR